ncbi:MAG: toprim domain-containing protein [bacterium]|nr:toprim domain-containing protein [bacterium]
MDKARKAAEYFSKLPGIGPRQARRLVYFLAGQEKRFLDGLAEVIGTLKEELSECGSCHRFFEGKGKRCDICESPSTDHSTMLVLEKDVDFENVRKLGVYHGRYFILGGLLPILEKNPTEKIRIRELVAETGKQIQKGLKEIIIALSVNPEGENTAQYVTKTLELLKEKHGLKLTLLGRGLSTGTELEYSDEDTLRNALKHRG